MLRASIAPLTLRGIKASVRVSLAVGTQSRLLTSKGRREDVIVPGSRFEYGSLGEGLPLPSKAATPWQAEHNIDVQRVTQKAIVYELTQQQTRTIEDVVPWFLEVMPTSYFRQGKNLADESLCN